MSPHTRKTLIFTFGFLAWLVADLWTKDWADRRLADQRHPIMVTASDADSDKTVTELVASNLGISPDGPEVATIASSVRLMPQAQDFTPETKIFAANGPAAKAQGFYIAWRDDLDLPPRRIIKQHWRLNEWLQMAGPKADPATVRRVAREYLDTVSFKDWIAQRIQGLSVERAAELLTRKGVVYPLTRAAAGPGPSDKVAPGSTYLIQNRRIDVMGDWFKFVYAENPGAAFGFLKGLDPTPRTLIFFFLTMIAFIVIIVINQRLPPSAWLISHALAGILAGAAGNFIDRFRYGYVIDFIDMDLGFMHWPTYNVADISITLGVLVLLGDMLFNKNSPLATVPADTKEQNA